LTNNINYCDGCRGLDWCVCDQYAEAVRLVVTTQKCSFGYLQSSLGISFGNAWQFTKRMQKDGIITRFGNGPGYYWEVNKSYQ